MSNKGDEKDRERLVECKYDAISRGSWDKSHPSPSFRHVNIRAEMVAAKGCGKLPWSGGGYDGGAVQVYAQLPLPPSLGRTDVSKWPTTHQPPLSNSRENDVFPTKFFPR